MSRFLRSTMRVCGNDVDTSVKAATSKPAGFQAFPRGGRSDRPLVTPLDSAFVPYADVRPEGRRCPDPSQGDEPIRALTLTVAAVAVFICLVPAAKSATPKRLRAREHQQQATIYRDQGGLRFCRLHPRAHAFCTAGRVRFLRAQIGWTRRELGETLAALSVVASTSAAALRWHPDAGWLRGALCVHEHESVDWHLAWRDYLGNRSPYAGGMQFLESTWRKAGGLGEPWQWSPREQLYRAFVVWRRDGGSWSEWGTRGACGLA